MRNYSTFSLSAIHVMRRGSIWNGCTHMDGKKCVPLRACCRLVVVTSIALLLLLPVLVVKCGWGIAVVRAWSSLAGIVVPHDIDPYIVECRIWCHSARPILIVTLALPVCRSLRSSTRPDMLLIGVGSVSMTNTYCSTYLSRHSFIMSLCFVLAFFCSHSLAISFGTTQNHFIFSTESAFSAITM